MLKVIGMINFFLPYRGQFVSQGKEMGSSFLDGTRQKSRTHGYFHSDHIGCVCARVCTIGRTTISADIDRMCKWFWPYSEISYQFWKHHCIPCQMPEVSVKDIMMLSCALGKLHDASSSSSSSPPPFPFSTLNVCQPKSGGMKHLARISTFQNFIKPKLSTVN